MVQKLIDDIVNNLNILEELPKKVNAELSRLDKEQCDVLHMIEFGRFNACDGYKLAKRLQDIRLERRDIKNIKEKVEKSKSTIDKYRSLKQSLNKSSKFVSEVDYTQGKKTYTARVVDNNDDITKLRSVNKTGIRFKNNKETNRMNSLFEQIASSK